MKSKLSCMLIIGFTNYYLVTNHFLTMLFGGDHTSIFRLRFLQYVRDFSPRLSLN